MIGLAATAQALLALTVDTAAGESITLPGRRYIAAGAAGQEAWDCEEGQVTVALVQLGSSLAVAQADAAVLTGDPAVAPLPSALLRLEITRGHPALGDDGSIPSATVLHAAGVAAMRDAALLHKVRSRILTESALTAGMPSDARPGAVTPSGPSGKVAGMVLPVAITIW